MQLALLQVFQQAADPLVFRAEQHRPHNIGHRRVGVVYRVVKILLADHAADVVQAAAVNRQAGKARLCKNRSDLLFCGGGRNAHHVRAGGHDFVGPALGKFDGAADQRPLLLVDAASLLHLFHKGEQLFLGDGAVSGRLKDQREQLFPLPEQKVHRGQAENEPPQQRGREHGEPLGRFLGDAFGRNLAKDQHHHGGNKGGNARPVLFAQKPHEQHGGQRGRGDVHNIVADQNGGEQRVVVFRQAQHQPGPLVALVGQAFELDAAERGKRGFSGRKIGGQNNTKNNNEQRDCFALHGRVVPFFHQTVF